MTNKHMTCINTDAIVNLLIEFVGAQAIMEFSEDEFQGVMKFIVYLIKRWNVNQDCERR